MNTRTSHSGSPENGEGRRKSADVLSRIEQFRNARVGTTGREFLTARRPVGNLVKRRSRRLG